MGMPNIIPGTGSRDQAITDIFESVALEQAALAHIINAEAKKIQAPIGNAGTTAQMLAVNMSVEDMVNSVARLEMVLQSKLNLFSHCAPPSTTTTTTTSTTSTTTTTT